MPSLSKYTIARELLRGPDAVLYAGHRDADGAEVILKAPRAEVPTPRQIARLRHERAILDGLEIPGVLRAIDMDVTDEGAALVLEAFRGQPLVDIIRTRRIDLGEALRIGVSLARTLAAIHAAGVIHRAFQPASVLLSDAGTEAKILDFSAASRLPEEHQELVSPRALEGAVAYLAPEQSGRMNRAIDHRADLYALGLTLFEVLLQGPPFSATDAVDLVHSHMARTPPSPRELSADVPAVVSDIVMRLLAKAPEDRYQSAKGLLVDLEECLRRWEAGGRVDAFPLGRSDRSASLVFGPLSGRDADLGRLAAAFDRVAAGAAELLLISGASGSGKSTLAHEIHRSIAENRRGLFAAGRFERGYRGAPHAPLMRPFRAILRHLLAERAEVLAEVRARLVAALGQHGQALVDVLPELAKIIGAQPRVPALSPNEAKNRFSLLFQGMVRVLATADHPLVLFLEDLQWAGPVTLDLLKAILTDPDFSHLLVIGAYREDEASGDHPLLVAVEGFEQASATITPIHLAPLSAAEVTQMVSGAIGCAPKDADPLASIAFEITGGDPLFLRRLLRALHEDKLLVPGDRGWIYDPAAIRAARIPQDAAAFFTDRIERLAPQTRRLVDLAACIAPDIDLRTLAAIAGSSQRDAATALWGALERGILVPTSSDHRLVHTGWDASFGDVPPSIKASYRFAHERLRGAAYARIAETERKETHLRVGWHLYRERRGDGDEAALFEIVHHLNLGASLLTDPGERLDLARMNLAAGRRAKARAGYATASVYFEAGATIVTDAIWDEEHDLAFTLHAERVECEQAIGRVAEAEALCEILLARAGGAVEKARAHELRLAYAASRGDAEGAIRIGRTALAILGIDLPEDARAAVDAELAEVSAQLSSRPIPDLLDAPEMEIPEQRAAIRILVALTAPAAAVSPALHTFVVAKQVTISLRHGHSDVSAYGYMAYAAIAARSLSRYGEAHALGKLALDLNDRFSNHELYARLGLIFGANIDFFTEHLRSSLEHLRRAGQAAVRTGDFQHLGSACTTGLFVRLSLGDGCMALREEIDRVQALLRRIKDETGLLGIVALRQAIDNLMGATRGRHTLSEGAFDETAHEAKLREKGHEEVALLYHAVKLMLAYLYEDYQGALRVFLRCEPGLADGSSHYVATEIVYYGCLTLVAVIPSSADEARRRYESMLAAGMAKLQRWAERCPDNFRHKHLLVLAEQARTEGEEISAMRLYEQAIESAGKSEFTRDEALANELSARFHLMSGRQKVARLYMTDAYRGYLRWGASSKVEQIIERHPTLVTQTTSTPPPTSRGDDLGTEQAEGLDLLAATRALRAISSEMLLDKLVDRLLRILIESAGAQRGVLVLSRDGRLVVEATITAGSPASGRPAKLERVKHGAPLPIEAGDALPAAIVRYVARTQEAVVLRDAAADDRFSGDPYITERRPKSIMCLAMTHQGRLTGALYLEHNAAFGAFGPTKLELCDLLASHAAIAVENAILYGHVQEATSALQQTNELLEDEVKRRTEELRAANELLQRELVTRKLLEDERTSAREEVIRVQEARLLELSTPLIPINDRVIVLPLIGEVDAARSMQVMEATLQGVQSRRAEVVILDVTGATGMNDEVASALVRTSNAVRLLGAQVVLTGLRPAAARTLVELGIYLGGVRTLGTVQDAIAYALKRTSKKGRAR